MKIGKYRKSKWLTKSDVDELSPEQRKTTILSISEEEVGDDLKPVCWFDGIEKGWPINMSGLDELYAATGSDETTSYHGVAVEIFVDPSVKYQGKRVGGIKLRPLKETPAQPAVTADGQTLDDHIPF